MPRVRDSSKDPLSGRLGEALGDPYRRRGERGQAVRFDVREVVGDDHAVHTGHHAALEMAHLVPQYE